MTFLSQEELFYSDDRNKLDSELDLNESYQFEYIGQPSSK